MNLKSIEINGFKSFRSKSIFKIDSNLIGIVGPNGSGKSNIIDAIRWVLGEQSAKNLRGGSMKDVIFSGTQEKREKNFAEVSITFSVNKEDKTITRRLYRNGDSEYLINGKKSKLKEITDIYFDLGINKESYSIITQGKVESILSSKPQDRRIIIEEAAGVLKYKNKKKETNLKLEKTEDNIKRLNDIFIEIKERYNVLYEQKELTEKYTKLKDELRKKDIIVNALNAKNYKLELEDLKSKADLYLKNIYTLEEDIKSLEKNVSDIKKNQVSLDKDYTEKKEKEVELIKEVEQFNSLLNLHKERANNKSNLLLKINKERDELFSRKNIIEEKINNLEEEINILKNNLAEVSSKLKILLAEKSNLSVSDIENNIENLKDEYFKLISLEGKLRNDLEFSKKVEDNNKQNINKINSEIYILENKLLDEKNKLNNINEDLLLKNKEFTALDIKISNCNSEYKLELANKDELVKNIYREKEILTNLTHKKNFLDNQNNNLNNYNVGVKEILKNKSNIVGVHNTIADIIRFDNKYTIALDTALSTSQQNIIVDNEDVAKKCIEHLKNNSKGRATFLPINSIKKKFIDSDIYSKISTENGFIDIASNLLSYEKAYSNIISYMLGNVIIVDNLLNGNKIAKKISYKYRIVTLDGQVINSGGSITGGAIFKNNNSIIKNKSEIEDLNKKILQIENRVQSFNKDLELCDYNLIKFSKKIENNVTIRSKLEIEIKELSLKNNLLLESIDNIKSAIEIENLKLDDINKLNNNNLNEEKIAEEILAIKKSLAEIDDKINEENNKKILVSKNEEDSKNTLNELNIEKSKIAENIKNKKYILEDTKTDLDYINSQILKINYEEKNIENEKLSSDDEESYKLQIKKIQENLDLIHKDIDLLKHKREELYSEDNLLNNQYKNKLVELKEYNKNLEKTNLKATKLEVKLDEIIEYLSNNYSVTYEKSEELLTNISSKEFSSYKEDVKKIKAEISSLGNVNMNAIEEFAEVSDRYNFYNSEITDLINSKEKLKSTIKEIDKEVEDRFLDTFNKVANNFNRIYSALFKGGNAKIILEEPNNILDTGINIEASPPGKKLQKLSLLSGGEKALTAISLLFAILEIKHSPFVILDEVEAALDDVNVNRFAKFLELYSEKNQFLVITHRRGTMEAMNKLYGVTMQEKGISYLLPLDLDNILKEDYVSE
ncbi:chromosome segregation protein SMC [Gemella sp. zg-1178]|uniref:chromosome segregation protein SMC n=1 Tax=Gemella sp. zg-1178 TaxID=2840372 RepID=UPI001C04B0A4|nr:chromosome segregation protein SMC [Gemella sp. zg-1178]MBU0278335.1 chromosome segregation protein SMC [Gemella sp. zg-1178]